MFKNIFKHKIIKDKSIFGAKPSDQSNLPMSPNAVEEIHDKPFEIDLENLSSYDQKELHTFIKKYDQYTHSLRGQFNDVLNECLLAREKMTLLEEERKRLMTENDQYKNQIVAFKKLAEQQNGAGESHGLDKEWMKQFENNSCFEFQNVDGLKENAEKLIVELKKIREELLSGVKVPEVKKEVEEDRQGQEQQVQDSQEEKAGTTKDSDSDSQHEAEQNVKENPENPEEEEVKKEVDNQVEEPQSQSPTQTVEKKDEVLVSAPVTVDEKISGLLEHVEAELKNVFVEHWKAIEMLLHREKDLNMRLNTEILKSGKIEEYEKQIKELKVTAEDAEKLLQDTIVELECKAKEIEEGQVKLVQEKSRHDEELALQKSVAEEIQNALNKIKEEDEVKKNLIEELKKENGELQKQLKEVKERLEESSEKVKQLEDIQKEYNKIQQRNQELETEKENYDENLNKVETKRNDTENSLIQEKLKHHQTSGDLARANEKLVEMEKNLNEEIEARKADVWKNEDLKKHIVELERKLKEYIKMIKKLSNKIAELENKDRLESNSSHRTNSEEDITEGSKNSSPNKEDYSVGGVGVGNNKYYETRLEDMTNQINELKETNQKLIEEKDMMKSQAKILQEKRETGLQEIKRLNVLLEQAKAKGQGQSPAVVMTPVERKSINFEAPKPVKVGSMTAVKTSKKSKAMEDLQNLRKIKKGLDEVYKSIIMTITTENMEDRKASGKLGELVKGPLPSENFMTIEKKMNDTIVLFQEYMENFE